jgi:hypothetical protein
MIHLWYHMIHLEILRTLYPNYPHSLPSHLLDQAPESWLEEMKAKCEEHARGIYRVLTVVEKQVQSHNKYRYHTQSTGTEQGVEVEVEVLDPSLGMVIFAGMKILVSMANEMRERGERDEEIEGGLDLMLVYVARAGERFEPARRLVSGSCSSPLLRLGPVLSFARDGEWIHILGTRSGEVEEERGGVGLAWA